MWKKKTYRKEPTLTAADRKRIAAIDESPLKIHQRYKVEVTFANPAVESLICIRLYGKDKEALKKSIEEHLANFQKVDKRWKAVKTEVLKSPESDKAGEQA